ncbi:sulfurtransferase [Pleionea sp. CnH1-48]|uniref:sulfurtransferase n=1 Tax=Pleionea sp. CnH1-48 TaxID=2954494 RepID=UPI0020968E11|nr:rhodanese-like domain-containing protein [Pleionea sp. CnH1-48]MCO7226931.1 rhodanese-like domain-containing protein [Pleionea sp. CnH1-48]
MQWEQLFIEAEQLRFLLKQPSNDLVLLDCRFSLQDTEWGQREHQQAHIADAHYVHLDHHLSGPITAQSGRHPLPSEEAFRQWANQLELTPDSQIVCYDQGCLAHAARAWWLLHLHGFHRVRLLNGGWNRWQQTSETAPTPSGALTSISIDLPIYSLKQVMESQAGDINLVDAREAKRFAGEEEPIDPIAGHIPNASNSVWLDCLDESGLFRPPNWHNAHWQHKISRSGNIINYCGSGVTALVNILSQLLAGVGSVGVYAGGWSEFIKSSYFKELD